MNRRKATIKQVKTIKKKGIKIMNASSVGKSIGGVMQDAWCSAFVELGLASMLLNTLWRESAVAQQVLFWGSSLLALLAVARAAWLWRKGTVHPLPTPAMQWRGTLMVSFIAAYGLLVAGLRHPAVAGVAEAIAYSVMVFTFLFDAWLRLAGNNKNKLSAA